MHIANPSVKFDLSRIVIKLEFWLLLIILFWVHWELKDACLYIAGLESRTFHRSLVPLSTIYWYCWYVRIICWYVRLTLVGRRPMKSLSVCLPIHPSRNFFKIRSLVFTEIIHDDSWPWYIVTDEARSLEKNWRPEFGPNGPKSGPKWVFLLFSWVWVINFTWNYKR